MKASYSLRNSQLPCPFWCKLQHVYLSSSVGSVREVGLYIDQDELFDLFCVCTDDRIRVWVPIQVFRHYQAEEQFEAKFW